MKIIKTSLRLWITLASLVSFLMGWVFLSHAEKPAPLQVFSSGITSSVSQPQSRSLAFNPPQGSFQFPSQLQSQFFSPRLRTGGS